MKTLRAFLALSLILNGAGASSACADEFADLVDGFGTTTRLIGTHQTTTTDPGTGEAINFWDPAYEGVPAIFAPLSNPHMAAADAFGNVYIADKASHSILKISADGLIHTFAGTHVAGFNGDGPAPATQLQINNPNGLYVFADGTVYILDPGNHRIRRIDIDGTMTTVVNDPDPKWYPSGRALWVSPDQQLIYYTNEIAPEPPSVLADGALVKQWTPAGGIEIVCSRDEGFRNPGNIAVNPVDGKLYVCDRAEDDVLKEEIGLWRIDGPGQRTRMTGNINEQLAASGQLALHSFIDQPRGIAFRPDGSYFICGHKNGSIWFVDTTGVLHQYIRGKGTKDTYSLPDGEHPPLLATDYFCQPRAITIAPNGTLLCVCNDSGFVFQVNSVAPPVLPADVQVEHFGADGLRFGWTGIFGHGYIVERTFGLEAPAWDVIGAVNGVGGLTEFLDAGAGSVPQAFYRLLPAQSGTGGANRAALVGSTSTVSTASTSSTPTTSSSSRKRVIHFSGSRRRTFSPM